MMKRYTLWVKCLTFFLAVVTLLGVAVSALGILMAENLRMYTQDDYEEWLYERYGNMADTIAAQVMTDYAAELSDCPQWILEQMGYIGAIENAENWFSLSVGNWYYTIQKDGRILRNTHTDAAAQDMLHFIFEKACSYPVMGVADEYTEYYYESVTDDPVPVHYENGTGYQVDVWISRNYTSTYMNNGLSASMMKWLFTFRHPLIIITVGSLLLFVIAFIFLLSIAGRDSRTGEISPKALNRLPLDLYLAAAVSITIVGCLAAYELLDSLFYSDSYNVLILIMLCGCGVIVATTDIGFFTAVASQFKMPNQFWWRHSICGHILTWLFKWVGKGFRFAYKATGKLFGMLPVMWEWIVVAAFLGIFLLSICVQSASHWYSVFPLFLWCLFFAAVVIYGGYCYGTIHKGIKRMREGNLLEKIPTAFMIGSFKSIAEDLNALADVVIVAAEKQLKSERMKTELITNVSHDIKTPLTSVINYVDLLQQPHTEEEGAQYLEVLSRQSLRLKKLVEDLMDMSKASTGNVAVNPAPMDAVEAVNQALGEFADKLDAAELTPVFRTSMPQMPMIADGRLTWRVLSNLLINVVKYALPGTRVYLDLSRQENCVVLSVKNISREELNISADELTERFVRGDASRNTEGSGLGLNIAQSLMRLQHGNMEVTVDGDLFKVTLTFSIE